MPKYGLVKYGKLHKYGKYQMAAGPGGGGPFEIGEHTPYRIRYRSHKGKLSRTVTMHQDRLAIPSDSTPQIRIRANNGEWVRSQHETIQEDAPNVRIRSIQSDGDMSEWVCSVRGNLQYL